jgi:hypothetical protein
MSEPTPAAPAGGGWEPCPAAAAPAAPASAAGPVAEWADLALLPGLVAAAETVYLRAALEPGDALQRHAADLGAAMRLSSANSVLFSARPVAAAATKRSFAARQLGWTAVWVLGCAWALSGLSPGLAPGALVRLRPLRQMDGAPPANRTGAAARFGLLEAGCPAAWPAAAGVAGGAWALTLERASAGPASGYLFELSAGGPAGGDPARWVVETSADGGAAWRPAVACAWVTVWVRAAAAGGGAAGPASFWAPAGGAGRYADCADGSVDLGPEVSLAAPLPRGAEVRVDVRPDVARVMEVASPCAGAVAMWSSSS